MAGNQKPQDRSNRNHTKAGPNSPSGGKNKGQTKPGPLYAKPNARQTNTTSDTVAVDIENFFNRLAAAVEKVADEGNWSSGSRDRAIDYVLSLVEGKAELPVGLNPGKITDKVQFGFALTCLILNVPDGTLPGQDQPWYDSCVRGAQNFRDAQRTGQLA